MRLFEIGTGFNPGFLEISGKISIGDVILRSRFSLSKYRTFCFIILRYFSRNKAIAPKIGAICYPISISVG